MKIKKLKNKHNEPIKILKNMEALVYDSQHYLANQCLGMFLHKNNKSFSFKPMDKYVKILEKIDVPDPVVENIIPRRRAVRKVLKHKSNKIKSKN